MPFSDAPEVSIGTRYDAEHRVFYPKSVTVQPAAVTVDVPNFSAVEAHEILERFRHSSMFRIGLGLAVLGAVDAFLAKEISEFRSSLEEVD